MVGEQVSEHHPPIHPNSNMSKFIRIEWILLIALLARLTSLLLWGEHLQEDRDGYLALAESLASGEGFQSVASGEPTAYRPPLYPFVVAALFKMGLSSRALGGLHLGLGILTVWLTFVLAKRLTTNPRIAFLAAGLVAVDPLLLRYTAFAMTETLFTFLLMLFLILQTTDSAGKMVGIRRQFLSGIVFGLCALCRPTIWAFGGLMMLVWGVQQVLRRVKTGPLENDVPLVTGRFQNVLAFTAGLLLIVAPWGIRNQLRFQKPIITTTHGGYTLLLGNNPVFYREVVEKSWGTVWQRESLLNWQENLAQDMKNHPEECANEAACDRWLYRRAFGHIKSQPGMFLRACLLRFLRFWNIVPLQSDDHTVPGWMRWSVGTFYGLEVLLLFIGVSRVQGDVVRKLQILVVLLVSFTSVHLFYWSNTRMRAPLIPAIAILAAWGVEWLFNHSLRLVAYQSLQGKNDVGNVE
ncbi:MAG: glycosyltransferase family 39 protein [Planctomycetaceae bacterium]